MNGNIKINLDNINYNSLFRIWRYTSTKIGRVSKTYIITKSFIRLIFFKIKFLEIEKNKPKVINTYQRKDYSDFIDRLTFNNSLGKCYLKYKFGLGHKWTYIKEVIKQAKLNKLEINETLLLYFLIKNNDVFIEYIKKELVIILFAEMQIFENYIAQLAKQVGCHTVGLQHGFYSNDYKKVTVNSINYKNVIVDEMFVWGKNTKDLLLEHNPNLKVTIVGRPSTHFLLGNNFNLNNGSPSSYLAILDAHEFSYTNDKVLKVVEGLANKNGVNFFIKYHPSNKPKDNHLQFNVLRDNKSLGLNPHFIGHRSSLLLELAADNFSCFVLEDSPFLKGKLQALYMDIYGKKLEPDDVLEYLAYTSNEAENLFHKEIKKLITISNQID